MDTLSGLLEKDHNQFHDGSERGWTPPPGRHTETLKSQQGSSSGPADETES